ncbi:hypothetical protein RF11_11394 [Thelohanellus kitauei]|uniref:Uncharacterized protein n=1 Tax=Thelohanellus kitauei TaxID=669202 RepID=A0A0C2N4Z4_THEKT|nr:hypothetical protein RF11_11394 [Thelohanellus kitauei]
MTKDDICRANVGYLDIEHALLSMEIQVSEQYQNLNHAIAHCFSTTNTIGNLDRCHPSKQVETVLGVHDMVDLKFADSVCYLEGWLSDLDYRYCLDKAKNESNQKHSKQWIKYSEWTKDDLADELIKFHDVTKSKRYIEIDQLAGLSIISYLATTRDSEIRRNVLSFIRTFIRIPGSEFYDSNAIKNGTGQQNNVSTDHQSADNAITQKEIIALVIPGN